MTIIPNTEHRMHNISSSISARLQKSFTAGQSFFMAITAFLCFY